MIILAIVIVLLILSEEARYLVGLSVGVWLGFGVGAYLIMYVAFPTFNSVLWALDMIFGLMYRRKMKIKSNASSECPWWAPNWHPLNELDSENRPLPHDKCGQTCAYKEEDRL